jgi:ribonucleotide monophosphatase NagD (HAD superfamily)
LTRYDVILLDQFGVLHNGAHSLPGAIEAVNELARAGKNLVVVSNTSQRQANAISRFQRLGFDPTLLSGFQTSGDAAFRCIKEKTVLVDYKY